MVTLVTEITSYMMVTMVTEITTYMMFKRLPMLTSKWAGALVVHKSSITSTGPRNTSIISFSISESETTLTETSTLSESKLSKSRTAFNDVLICPFYKPNATTDY